MFRLLGKHAYVNSIHRLSDSLIKGIASTVITKPTKDINYPYVEIINKFNTKICIFDTFRNRDYIILLVFPRFKMRQAVHFIDSTSTLVPTKTMQNLSFLINYEEVLIDIFIKYVSSYS